MIKIKQFFVNLDIFFEWLFHDYLDKIKTFFRSFRNVRKSLKPPTSPKYLMFLCAGLAFLSMAGRKNILFIIFFILFLFFYLQKKYVSGDWRVYYKEKYGLEK